MIFVRKPDITDPEFVAIVAEGKTLRQAHIECFRNGTEFKIKDVLYKRYKRYLVDVFHGKCAYCESPIAADQPVDVEHFRPKCRVVGDDFKPVTEGELEHPGYYWLAYEWENLLPSCIDCNRYRRHGVAGAGKADRFPVAAFRAWQPGDEKREEPLLIDPSRLDPRKHLEFEETGLVKGLTEVGRRTIELFGLNSRERLVEARRRAFAHASEFIETYWGAVASKHATKVQSGQVRLQAIREGAEPYAAMHRLGIRIMKERIQQELERQASVSG